MQAGALHISSIIPNGNEKWTSNIPGFEKISGLPKGILLHDVYTPKWSFCGLSAHDRHGVL